MEAVQEDKTTAKQGLSSSLTKLPSLDFNRALQQQETNNNHQQRHLQHKHNYLEDSGNFDSRVEINSHRPCHHDIQNMNAWKDQTQPHHATSPRGHRHVLRRCKRHKHGFDLSRPEII